MLKIVSPKGAPDRYRIRNLSQEYSEKTCVGHHCSSASHGRFTAARSTPQGRKHTFSYPTPLHSAPFGTAKGAQRHCQRAANARPKHTFSGTIPYLSQTRRPRTVQPSATRSHKPLCSNQLPTPIQTSDFGRWTNKSFGRCERRKSFVSIIPHIYQACEKQKGAVTIAPLGGADYRIGGYPYHHNVHQFIAPVGGAYLNRRRRCARLCRLL